MPSKWDSNSNSNNNSSSSSSSSNSNSNSNNNSNSSSNNNSNSNSADFCLSSVQNSGHVDFAIRTQPLTGLLGLRPTTP